VYNLLSGLTFLIGGLLALALSARLSVDFLIPFAAGNFLYIGAADLIPEFKEAHDGRPNIAGTLSWIAGFGVVLLVRLVAHVG
jgi:zinc and cadmium transporter